MKYLNDRSLAVAAQPGVLLRSGFVAWRAFSRIYHYHVAHSPGVPFHIVLQLNNS
jgi:hypothetical protein